MRLRRAATVALCTRVSSVPTGIHRREASFSCTDTAWLWSGSAFDSRPPDGLTYLFVVRLGNG
eukprot:COSAG04_NODE_1633_length_6104_cov_3.956536_10_plen_63_part_00